MEREEASLEVQNGMEGWIYPGQGKGDGKGVRGGGDGEKDAAFSRTAATEKRCQGTRTPPGSLGKKQGVGGGAKQLGIPGFQLSLGSWETEASRQTFHWCTFQVEKNATQGGSIHAVSQG